MKPADGNLIYPLSAWALPKFIIASFSSRALA